MNHISSIARIRPFLIFKCNYLEYARKKRPLAVQPLSHLPRPGLGSTVSTANNNKTLIYLLQSKTTSSTLEGSTFYQWGATMWPPPPSISCPPTNWFASIKSYNTNASNQCPEGDGSCSQTRKCNQLQLIVASLAAHC